MSIEGSPILKARPSNKEGKSMQLWEEMEGNHHLQVVRVIQHKITDGEIHYRGIDINEMDVFERARQVCSFFSNILWHCKG